MLTQMSMKTRRASATPPLSVVPIAFIFIYIFAPNSYPCTVAPVQNINPGVNGSRITKAARHLKELSKRKKEELTGLFLERTRFVHSYTACNLSGHLPILVIIAPRILAVPVAFFLATANHPSYSLTLMLC